MSSDMSIGTVAQKTGTPTSTIRYYESIGILPEPSRVNGRRHYDDSVLLRLAAIHRAQEAGWTLAEIKELFYGFSSQLTPSSRWKTMAPQKIEELDELIQRTQQMKAMLEMGMGCDCNTLTECGMLSLD